MKVNRNDFLLRMYDQLFNDINRHIMVIWQSIVVLTGAIAALILQGKNILPASLATSIIIIITAWVIAHTFDSSFWYNRNLVIISNIEKQFLEEKDIELIHYYFAQHRPKNKMISHLKLQFYLALAIGVLAIIYQLYNSWLLSFNDRLFCLPIFVALIAIFLVYEFKKGCDRRYAEFKKKSPGKKINSDVCDDTIGHGNS